MNKKIIISTLVLAFLTGFQSCKKQVINNIEGKWKYWHITSEDSITLDFWEFRKPNLIFRTIFYIDTVITDTGYWEVTKDFLEPTYIEFKSLRGIFDGTYQILKLNKKYMFLQRYKLPGGSTNGAFLRLEFTKE